MQQPDYTPLILSSLTAIGVLFLTKVFDLFIQRRKEKTDVTTSSLNASKELADATIVLIEPLRKEIGNQALEIMKLKTDWEILRDVIRDWFTGISILTHQIQKTGKQPMWKPEVTEHIDEILGSDK